MTKKTYVIVSRSNGINKSRKDGGGVKNLCTSTSIGQKRNCTICVQIRFNPYNIKDLSGSYLKTWIGHNY